MSYKKGKMPQEIERKFLVTGEFKPLAHASERITQGYLCRDRGKTVRIRVAGNRAFITVKGPPNPGGASRYEWEKEIPLQDAGELMRLCGAEVIEKRRYYITAGRHTFEVDEFEGENRGLVIAEIELSSEDEEFIKPGFLGEEVTGDARYYNSMLVAHPCRKWDKTNR